MAKQNELILGTDVIIGKNVTLVSGYKSLGLQLMKRLSTRRGTLFYDLNYGDDLRLFMNRPINQAILDQIKYTIKSQCEQDPRVNNADVTVNYNNSTLSLEVDIFITTLLGPFTLVISVNALTIDLITLE
jgi:phage baseplate assembly protein W